MVDIGFGGQSVADSGFDVVFAACAGVDWVASSFVLDQADHDQRVQSDVDESAASLGIPSIVGAYRVDEFAALEYAAVYAR